MSRKLSERFCAVIKRSNRPIVEPGRYGERVTRSRWLPAVLLLVLVTASGCSAGAGGNGTTSAPPSAGSATPAETSTATPVAPSATPDPAAGAAVIPPSCESIYSPGYLETLRATPGVVLNPEWTATPGQATLGTQEATLLPLLESREHLDCFWVAPGGGSGMGLSTSVSLAASDEQASLVAQLTAAGFGCTEQSGGTRCAVERTDEFALWGETHFVGGGLWIATFYVDFAPDGYTDDIVKTLVPA